MREQSFGRLFVSRFSHLWAWQAASFMAVLIFLVSIPGPVLSEEIKAADTLNDRTFAEKLEKLLQDQVEKLDEDVAVYLAHQVLNAFEECVKYQAELFYDPGSEDGYSRAKRVHEDGDEKKIASFMYVIGWSNKLLGEVICFQKLRKRLDSTGIQ